MNRLINKLKETKYIFFDLDGTLIDTEKIYFRFWKLASRLCGYELSDEQLLSFRSLDSHLAEQLIREYSGGVLDYKTTRQKRIELMDEYFKTHEIEVKPGVYELLTLLKEDNKKLYIVTATKKERTEEILKETKLDGYFDGVISTKDVARGKPFPDVYVYACEQLNININEVVVFEDSPNGLVSSHDAGCYTVMVEDLTPYTPEMRHVDAHIGSLAEIIDKYLV